jgi:crotonobetainyl-CoA:carnitine CoA-transferase CaiB-like acyl-CoA transferase
VQPGAGSLFKPLAHGPAAVIKLIRLSEKSKEIMTSEKENKGDAFLSGIKILDLADQKASFGTKLLADLGARVIKIEKPGGDPARKTARNGRKSSPSRPSPSFYYHNTNKLGITLNLEHPKGKELLFRLVKRNDVVVETFSPGYLQKQGLGFDRLTEANPGIILVSVTGYGQSGPKKDYKTCDLVAAASGGQMYVTGAPDSYPLQQYGEQSYLAASLFAAVAILIAVRRQRRGGKGQHIDIALQEAVLSTLEHIVLQYFSDHVTPKRQGKMHWNHLFHILPCQDGFIQLTLFEQWETLVEWMDSEGMAADLTAKKWRDNEYRLKHLDHIITVLESWTKTHKTAELFKLGQLMQFPWAPVQSPTQILSCPQLKARDFFTNIKHPDITRPLRYPKIPFKFNESLPASAKRAPLVAEDNRTIYCQELGISERELKRLLSEGVI